MRNNSNSRGGRRPPSAERKRTPFRRPGEGNLPRTRRVREDAPFSERAGLASQREAFGQMESEADGYRGFADRPIALDIIDRARQQQTPADLPTEKLQKALGIEVKTAHGHPAGAHGGSDRLRRRDRQRSNRHRG